MRIKFWLLFLLLLLPTWLMVAEAQAVTPANTTISNTASLVYDGQATPITASVDVKVSLVPRTPTLSKPTVLTQGPDDNSVAESQPSTANYRLTTNSNGPDTFNLTQAMSPTNLTGTSGTVTYLQGATPITSITLGATAASLAASSGQPSITVPYDGNNGDSAVNGIKVNDLVRIGSDAAGNDYIVQGISENPGGGTAIITFTTNLVAGVGIGDLLREYQLFDMKIANVGTATGANPYVDVTTTATSTTNGAATVNDVHRTNVVQIGFAKYIRNVDTPNGSGTPVTLNTHPFFPTSGGVTAAPGETIEYALVVTTAAAGLTGGVLTDTAPAFTTYVLSSTYKDGATLIPDVAGALPLLSPGYALGTIVGAQTVIITFQVKLDE